MDHCNPADGGFLYYYTDTILLRQQHPVIQCRSLTSDIKCDSTIASDRVLLYVHKKLLLAASFSLRK